MIRPVILTLLILGVLVVIAPFVISSSRIDDRGVLMTAHIQQKDERITVHDAQWTRLLNITIEYEPPDEPGVAFHTSELDAERFDQLKKGDAIQVRYLRKSDVPALPGANVMRQMHLLPMVRLAEQSTWSGWHLHSGALPAIAFSCMIAIVLVLVAWRWTRLPLLACVIAAFFVWAVWYTLTHEFPTPLPPPTHAVQSASGTVNSLEELTWLFRDKQSRGFEADQPVDIIGVQFVPHGRVEPVVAVDLIDAGSLPGLREGSAVVVDYESETPRMARIRGPSRDFASRNLRGIIIEIVASLLVLIVCLLVAWALRKGYRRLTQRSR